MIKAIGRTVLLVRDYDEALSFYRDILGFQVLFDETTDSGQRLLHAGLPGQLGVGLWFLQPGAWGRGYRQDWPSDWAASVPCAVHRRLPPYGSKVGRARRPVQKATARRRECDFRSFRGSLR
jgi:catechol 2,3-dioxygenase-like lactoylglutathione lyase family enzyme